MLSGISPHLRLQSDERLVALTRRGHHGAFEALVKRYQPRLLAFCRHMLGSAEDAEDVLQEVMASAYNAICADEREITARPWLYRIARNRCLNHMRRPQDAKRESMDEFERAHGATTADTVHRREELRQIVADVQDLPESQRTALVLREMDSLSYDQIAHAMETTVPSVKSLLVRARTSLAEASEARRLTCAEVRLELSQAFEGIARASAPARRHVRSCGRCRAFKRDLRSTSKALAAVYPVGPLVALKQIGLAKLGGGSAGAVAGETAASSAAAGGASLFGGGAAGLVSVGAGSIASKAAAGLVAAAIVTAGAVEVRGTERAGKPERGAEQAAPGAQAASARDRDRRGAGGERDPLSRSVEARPPDSARSAAAAAPVSAPARPAEADDRAADPAPGEKVAAEDRLATGHADHGGSGSTTGDGTRSDRARGSAETAPGNALGTGALLGERRHRAPGGGQHDRPARDVDSGGEGSTAHRPSGLAGS